MRLRFCFSFLLLFAGSLNSRPTRAQLTPQPKLPSSEPSAGDANANTTPTSINKTIAVILPKSLDAQKLKGGETYIVDRAYSILNIPSGTQILMRVVDASPLNKNANESLISLQFEPLHPDPSSGRAPVLHLEIQAVASPSSIVWSPSLVMVDPFPCDPKVARNGCDKPDNDDPASRLGSMLLTFCDKDRPKKQQTTRSGCASQDEARGIYGYPDLSLSRNADGKAGTSSVTSVKKNVKFEKGTYLVLAGPDIDAIEQQQP